MQGGEMSKKLFEKFSNYYDVNEWTPESGFDNPLDFYIHETTKRDLKFTALEAENASLQKQLNIAAKIKGDNKEEFDWAILTQIDELETENASLSQRVSQFDKVIRSICTELNLCYGGVDFDEGEIVQQISSLQKQVEDLQCCGNCINVGTYHAIMDIDFAGLSCKNLDYNNLCGDWQSDNMKKGERNGT
jgi:hypothetical protein